MTTTAMVAGMIETQKTVRYAPGAARRIRKAMPGPSTAPNWSMAR